MKIYNSSTAPNPRRVRVFLAEKGIQVPYEEVDLVKAVNRGPGIQEERIRLRRSRSWNSMTAPVSRRAWRICRYFEELHSNPPLFGVNAKDRALVEMCGIGVSNLLCSRQSPTHSGSVTIFFKGRIRQVPEYAEAQSVSTQEDGLEVARRRASANRSLHRR